MALIGHSHVAATRSLGWLAIETSRAYTMVTPEGGKMAFLTLPTISKWLFATLASGFLLLPVQASMADSTDELFVLNVPVMPNGVYINYAGIFQTFLIPCPIQIGSGFCEPDSFDSGQLQPIPPENFGGPYTLRWLGLESNAYTSQFFGYSQYESVEETVIPFVNQSPSPVVIDIPWIDACTLDTVGVTSSASINIAVSEDDPVFGPIMPYTVIYSAMQGSDAGANDCGSVGQIQLNINANSQTDLRVYDPTEALASVPEPADTIPLAGVLFLCVAKRVSRRSTGSIHGCLN